MSSYTIAVVGNPNCGKTTLFNLLTGSRQRVGNWPGVTVDRKVGSYNFSNNHVEVVDLPGIYSLSAVSIDEIVARDYVLSNEADVIVNIIDASNLERNLYLTTQLLEMRVPMIVALNMMDIAEERGISIDIQALSKKLDCPVVDIVASKKSGINALMKSVDAIATSQAIPNATVNYPDVVEGAIDALIQDLKTDSSTADQSRWQAIKLLEEDEQVLATAPAAAIDTLRQWQETIEQNADEESDILIADCRYNTIFSLLDGTIKKKSEVTAALSERIDNIVLNRVLGIPIFLMVMYLMFMFAINFGSAFIDFFDIAGGALFVDTTRNALTALNSPDWLITILASGVGGGLQTVSTFIPPVGFLFLFLALLEDSGYMARAAFVIDRFMRFIGLPGKSFVPMLVGFGCNVPGIMATRTLENDRDRIMTIMMNPFMSCGARLPVYALFAAAFFPVGGQNLVFALYLLGIGFAVLTGLVMKNTLLRGEAAPFIMELPPYHVPTARGVLTQTWQRLKAFMLKAGKIIIAMVVVLSFLNSIGSDGSFGNEDSEQSILSAASRSVIPVFEPMGLTDNNWPAVVGIFTGVFAKEVVVGTLDALYAQMAGDLRADEAEPTLMEQLSAAVATIPENLTNVANNLLDPLGLNIGDTQDLAAASDEQAVALGTFGVMVNMFDGKVGAVAYLLFILLYAPCVAATTAVYRETNLKWASFVVVWTTGLAYAASTSFYQASTYSSHPDFSTKWLSGVLAVSLIVFAILRLIGNRRAPSGTPVLDGS